MRYVSCKALLIVPKAYIQNSTIQGASEAKAVFIYLRATHFHYISREKHFCIGGTGEKGIHKKALNLCESRAKRQVACSSGS